MTRPRKTPIDTTAISERDARRKVLLAQVIASSGLAADDVRAEVLSWALLALDGEKQRLLRGHAVSITLWEDICTRLTGLCPKAETLTIKYLYRCQDCLTESDTDPTPGVSTHVERVAAARASKVAQGDIAPAAPADAPEATPEPADM